MLAEFKDPVYDAAGITLITASVRRPAPDCLDPKIHHNNLLPSILAKIEANVAGADDAVVLDHRGFIAETNATHLFMVTGGRLATPTTASCPEGITRAAVLELAAAAGIGCEVGDYTLPQLYNAEESFVTGTMGGLAPVLSVDGRTIGDGTPGAVTKRLTALYADLTATTGTSVTLTLQALIVPSSSSRTESAMSMRPGSCVATRAVTPSDCTTVRSSRMICFAVSESSWPVGSSASSTCGRPASARAIATRCCWPPDSSPGRCRACSPRPTMSSMSRTRLSRSFGAIPAIRSGTDVLRRTGSG